MTAPASLKIIAIVLATALVGATPARSDGDDFFQSMDTPLTSQLIFVGTVKDETGAHVSGALVTWQARAQDGDEELATSSGTYTDAVGRYRTLDVVHIAHGAGLDVDPARVELMVTKPGYTLLRRLRRTSESQKMGLIEVNFIIAKTKATRR